MPLLRQLSRGPRRVTGPSAPPAPPSPWIKPAPKPSTASSAPPPGPWLTRWAASSEVAGEEAAIVLGVVALVGGVAFGSRWPRRSICSGAGSPALHPRRPDRRGRAGPLLRAGRVGGGAADRAALGAERVLQALRAGPAGPAARAPRPTCPSAREGLARCRLCNGPLDVPAGALGVGVPLCQADNLVALPLGAYHRPERAGGGQASPQHRVGRGRGPEADLRKSLGRTLKMTTFFAVMLTPGAGRGWASSSITSRTMSR